MLRDVFPLAHFAPAASETEIAAVEAVIGFRLPEQLRRLYLICNGFREDRGNAKYLFSLNEEPWSGSLLSNTRFLWAEFTRPDLRPFVFFGLSCSDEWWGISWKQPDMIIAYHHHMEGEYEVIGTDIITVYQANYARYEALGHGM